MTNSQRIRSSDTKLALLSSSLLPKDFIKDTGSLSLSLTVDTICHSYFLYTNQ